MPASENKIQYRKNTKRKERFDKRCEDLIYNRGKKESQNKMTRVRKKSEVYKSERTQVMKLCKKKKREWRENKLEEIETENKRNNVRLLYQFMKWKRKTTIYQ